MPRTGLFEKQEVCCYCSNSINFIIKYIKTHNNIVPHLLWTDFQSVGESSSGSWALEAQQSWVQLAVPLLGSGLLIYKWAEDEILCVRKRDWFSKQLEQFFLLRPLNSLIWMKLWSGTEFGMLNFKVQLLPLLFLLRGLLLWFVTYKLSKLYSGLSKTGYIIVLKIPCVFFFPWPHNHASIPENTESAPSFERISIVSLCELLCFLWLLLIRLLCGMIGQLNKLLPGVNDYSSVAIFME